VGVEKTHDSFPIVRITCLCVTDGLFLKFPLDKYIEVPQAIAKLRRECELIRLSHTLSVGTVQLLLE